MSTKQKYFFGLFALSIIVVGLGYTNCGSNFDQKTDATPSSQYQKTLAEKDSIETDTEITSEGSQPYGESTVGFPTELVGRTYTLPLTGTVIQIESAEIDEPKIESEQRCQLDIGVILKNMDLDIMVKQAANEVIDYEKIGQWVKLKLNSDPSDSTAHCGGDCGGDHCCKVKLEKKVLVKPTSQFVFSKNILEKPVKLKSGKTITVKNVTTKNEAGDFVDSDCYLDLNDSEFDSLRGPTLYKRRTKEVKTEEGTPQELTICKGRGYDCVIEL